MSDRSNDRSNDRSDGRGAEDPRPQEDDSERAERAGEGEPVVEAPWALEADELLDRLEVDPEHGLTEEEVEERRRRFGRNRLRERKRRGPWKILWAQLANLIVALLAAAAAVAFVFGENVEGLAVVAVLVINTALGFFTELRAVRSMEALRELARSEATVRRGGASEKIPAEQLVPGDVVLLDAGDVVSADLRLVEASKLQADESALTGESVPVSKETAALDREVVLAERRNMVFKGTAVTRGAGEGVVVAIGMDTELGHISSLVEEAEEEETPLTRRLDVLGRRLVWLTLGIAVVVGVIGALSGRDLFLIVETAIALAVAAVPEGLPIVATLAQARGMWRMVQRNVVVERLSAVETLGSTSVILTDKTGTLTENRMTVTRLLLDDGAVEIEGRGLALEGEMKRDGESVDPAQDELVRRALEVGVLCNNASLEDARREDDTGHADDGEERRKRERDRTGDEEEDDGGARARGEPMEVALLVAGRKAGIERRALLEQAEEVREVAFDPEVKMMATFHAVDEGCRVAVKGAPEAVLEAAARVATADGGRELDDSEREHWLEESDRLAGEGLRMLALAERRVESSEAEPYEELELLGLVGLLDPPREEVADSLAACDRAGIEVVMITGDHAATARNIAAAVGLTDEDAEVLEGRELDGIAEADEQRRERALGARIFARSSPKQKLDLIALHQEGGAIVAMTGDGVNDAPALKKADIGVAMGVRGTEVAKQAADMVLRDDSFASIVAAVEEGRVIFDNIRRFVLFLLSCNVSEIMVIGLASAVQAPLPVLPLQILFLNLVTDVFPALALGVGEGSEEILERPPRDPEESILTGGHWRAIGIYSALITAAVLGGLAAALELFGMAEPRAVTVSFLILAFAQLWHVFNMRGPESRIFDNEITRNLWVWGALLLCSGLLVAAVYLPGLSTVLETVDPGLDGWALVLGASLLPLVVGQGARALFGWGGR